MDLAAFRELSRGALEITDALGIHREAVAIPLHAEGPGRARLASPTRLEILGPEDGDVAAFLERLPALLSALDLDSLPRANPPEDADRDDPVDFDI